MKIKIAYILIALSALSINYSDAQIDKSGGSLYSIFGVGDLSYSTGTRTDGMGIMGIALYGKYANGVNPAAWTRIPYTTFTSKMELVRTLSTDGTNTAKRTNANFETFALSIPLNKGNGWIFDLSMHNYSNVNYDTKFDGSSLGETYTQTYSGNGGLERISAGFSYLIFRYFSFGFQFNYAYGNIVRSTSIDFANAQLADTKNTLSDEIRGFYFNTGLIFHGFGKIFKSKKLDNMTVGVNFSTPFKMNSTLTGIFNKSTGADSITVTEGKLEMPYALGIGISNEFGGKLIVAADIFMQNWDKYKYYDVHPAEIKNNFRAGLGFEYTPSRKLADPFYKRVSYRLGGSYTKDYVYLYNEQINSIGMNAGLSLPISRYNSLDLSFSYQLRGKSTNGLIKDNLFKFGATVNIGELWFLRPTDDF